MPPGREAWNARLVEALRRQQEHAQATLKSTWHRWKVDADTLEAVKKDIWITAEKTSVKDLPREGAQFSKRARELCENIMKGHTSEIPKGYQESAPTPSTGSGTLARAEHPYLQKMEFRGGGYAILMACHEAEQDPGYLGSMTIQQICKCGQKHCNVEMKANHWAGNDHGHGWESNKSLKRYNLITRDNHGRGPASGWRGPVDAVRLTEEGRDFIWEMLKKFGVDSDANLAASSSSRSLDDDGAPAVPLPLPGLPGRSRPISAVSIADETELQEWAQAAAIGENKIFNVSHARRLHLHKVADQLSASATNWQLSHSSLGVGRDRQLVITKG
jgi:hypothetical protein